MLRIKRAARSEQLGINEQRGAVAISEGGKYFALAHKSFGRPPAYLFLDPPGSDAQERMHTAAKRYGFVPDAQPVDDAYVSPDGLFWATCLGHCDGIEIKYIPLKAPEDA